MTIYTDSISNLKNYAKDFYRIAVSTSLPYSIQNKLDAWFYELSPSKSIIDKYEQGQITWDQFTDMYYKEMDNAQAKSRIAWIKDFSKRNDVVILCHEKESDSKCHRHVLKTLIEKK